MSAIYVHLSDIHFGQEKGGDIFIHDDVKEQLLSDVHDYVGTHFNNKVNGIIISGDIAYAGKHQEYVKAGEWLDRLTASVGCDLTSVQVVPGNHDIDLDKITPITQLIIEDIIEKGDDALDRFMEKEEDRDILYKQFSAYRTFAEAYNSPLDNDGRILGHRVVEIAPSRKIKFHGVNTALICSKSEKEKGGLLLGKRQRVLPIEAGTELVVIAHHPLNWLQDSEDAMLYIKNRARVFISGHEHKPSHKVEPIDRTTDLLMLAAGATVPPPGSTEYNYCYNILEFNWDEKDDRLTVAIHGRMWDDSLKAFNTDNVHFNNGNATYTLQCPNFKKLPVTCIDKISAQEESLENANKKNLVKFPIVTKANSFVEDKEYQLVLLRFFRDLSAGQRLSVLIELGAIPTNWKDPLTHTLERRALDQLVENGKLEEIHRKINQNLYPNNLNHG